MDFSRLFKVVFLGILIVVAAQTVAHVTNLQDQISCLRSKTEHNYILILDLYTKHGILYPKPDFLVH